MSPCPICGHNNDFQIDKIKQTWHCHSSATENNNGGTIIDFLIWKDGLAEKEAIAHFKYELCGIDPGEDMQNYLAMRMLANARKNGFVLDGEGLPDYLQFNKRQKCYSVSAPLLAEYIRQHENFITVHDRNGRENKIFWYAHGVYSPVNDSIIQAYIKRYVEVFDITLIKMSQIREVLQDIRASHDFVDRSKLNADEDIINFQNGLYHLESGELTEHDPSVLSTIQLPCEYDPNAKQHSKFDSYIWRLTGGDTELMELICQFMGIAITNVDGSRFKKAMILFGAGDTGKSQILKLTQRLLGNDNYSSGGLSDLENERFGSSALYNKRLFGDADMSYASVREMKVFKQATGGDNIRGEFKNENSFSFQYRGLLWFCANALPNFGGDRGSWVYERIIPIKCDNVIPRAEQDARLLDKMFEERAAIIADVLIPAAKRAINNGYRFTVPAVCADILEKYKKDNSPAVSFYSECCEIRKADDPCKDRFTCAEVYTCFVGWYSVNYSGHTAISKNTFRKEIAAYLNTDTDDIVVKKRNNYYYIFTMKADNISIM